MMGEWQIPEDLSFQEPPKNNTIVGHIVQRLINMAHPSTVSDAFRVLKFWLSWGRFITVNTTVCLESFSIAWLVSVVNITISQWSMYTVYDICHESYRLIFSVSSPHPVHPSFHHFQSRCVSLASCFLARLPASRNWPTVCVAQKACYHNTF